jgi:hypothetical protein
MVRAGRAISSRTGCTMGTWPGGPHLSNPEGGEYLTSIVMVDA